MSCIGAGYQCFRWNAAGIDAGSTEKLSLNDGDIHPGRRQASRQRWSCLSGPNDDYVVLGHGCPLVAPERLEIRQKRKIRSFLAASTAFSQQIQAHPPNVAEEWTELVRDGNARCFGFDSRPLCVPSCNRHFSPKWWGLIDVFVEGKSRREAARVFGLSRDTIAKMCRYSVPPGYVRSKTPERPKLGPLVPVIDAILEADKTAPPKQRHTAKRIFERLRIEHGYAGGYTVVKDYVRIARARSREVFIPLAHPPGHAQVDFGECVGVIGGVRMKLHVFCFDLPQSDACFIKAYPAETTEAFLDGHVSAFAFLRRRAALDFI